MVRPSDCKHVLNIGDYSGEDIDRKREISRCDFCDTLGQNLWVCLHKDCFKVGCGEAFSDHSAFHFDQYINHCLQLNLSTLRVWCYVCRKEVFLDNNTPKVNGPLGNVFKKHQIMDALNNHSDSEESGENHDSNLKPRGLTGLQNIGNTCYMNAALQALSNAPPLTNFFLDCGITVAQHERKPGLAKTFHRLMEEMWNKKRPNYVVPSGILYGIRMVHPMFRGYQQHDTQEFLRCFMDQLHEELKEVVIDPNAKDKDDNQAEVATIDEISDDDLEAASSQSEGEYETCDSGVSEKSVFSEESCKQNNEVWKKEDRKRKIKYSQLPTDLKKEMKDNMNLAQQIRGGSSEDLSAIEMEFSDAVSDTPMIDTLSRSSSPTESKLHRKSSASQLHSQSPSSGRGSTASPQLSMKFNNHNMKRRKVVKTRSIISDVFDGKVLSSVQCLTCDRVSTTIEAFQDLSLPIPNRDHLHVLHQGSFTPPQKGGFASCSDMYSNQGWISWMWDWMRSWFWGPTVSLHDCLAAFFSADELKGDNMYSCEKCKKLRNGVKYSRVLELPEMLCIHLKRFRHELMFSTKISSFVSFPLQGLDMTPHIHKDCSSEVMRYKLMAVICHHGTAGGGHYTCYALNYINEHWYEFDDQYVTEVNAEAILNCEAYVLFYKKTSEEMNRCRERTIDLIERSRSESALMQFYVSKQWVNKFNTFAEPGPIDNSDFLCLHGAVQPTKTPIVKELCTVLSQSVWEYLHRTFGGGPACNCLYECEVCRREQEILAMRQGQELQEFLKLNQEFHIPAPTVVYAISMSWFRRWEEFVRGKESEPPCPIENQPIIQIKNGQQVLRPASDYAQLSEDMWNFLHGIYGGGPPVILRHHQTPLSPKAQSSDNITMTHLPRTLPAKPLSVSADNVTGNNTSPKCGEWLNKVQARLASGEHLHEHDNKEAIIAD